MAALYAVSVLSLLTFIVTFSLSVGDGSWINGSLSALGVVCSMSSMILSIRKARCSG